MKRSRLPRVFAKKLAHLTALSLSGLLLLMSLSAAAAPRKRLRLRNKKDNDLVNLLLDSNMRVAVAAAKELGRRSSTASLDSLLQQLLLGHPPQLSRTLLKALAARRDPKSFKTLMFYAKHRSPALRIAALQALTRLKVKKGSKIYNAINTLLMKSLRDYSPLVRAKAAWHLGKRRVYAAESDLLALFAKGSIPAIQALGFIGGIRTARAFALALEKRKTQKEVVINTIGTMLLRRDFGPEPVRVQLVKILGLVSLPGAQTVLLKYSGSGPARAKRSKKLAYKILSSK